jgi:hypothetical protein
VGETLKASEPKGYGYKDWTEENRSKEELFLIEKQVRIGYKGFSL